MALLLAAALNGAPTHLDPAAVNRPSVTGTAGTALAAGDLVNVDNNGSVTKADAATGKAATGFVLVAVANGAVATVYTGGNNTARAGLTPGAAYYLGANGGLVLAAASEPAVGGGRQPVGYAQSATVLAFNPGELSIRN